MSTEHEFRWHERCYPGPDTPEPLYCHVCGSLVGDASLHSKWHAGETVRTFFGSTL